MLPEKEREVMVGSLEWPTETFIITAATGQTKVKYSRRAVDEDMGSDLVEIVRLFPTLYCNFVPGVKGRTLFPKFTTGLLST